MHVVGVRIDTRSSAGVLRWAHAGALLAHRQSRARSGFIDHTITIVVFGVALLGGTRIGLVGAVVAIGSAANDGRLTVVVLVERRIHTNGRCWIATNLVFARIRAESVDTRRIIGANDDIDATIVELANFSRGTRCRTAIGADDMFTCARIACINGAIESITAVCGRRTTPRATIACRTPAASGTCRATGTRGHSPGAARVSASGARTANRIAPGTVTAH